MFDYRIIFQKLKTLKNKTTGKKSESCHVHKNTLHTLPTLQDLFGVKELRCEMDALRLQSSTVTPTAEAVRRRVRIDVTKKKKNRVIDVFPKFLEM